MDKTTKYRRPFDWRIGHGEATPTASAAFARLFTSEYPDLLEDLLQMSRVRRHNRTAIAKLQMWMLQELLVQESAVKHYRETRQQLKADLEKPSSEQRKDETQKKLGFVDEQLFFHRAYANCLRIIGDGIAWRSLGYDRLVMKSLAGAATKAHVSSEGTVKELCEWSMAFDSGQGVPLLNSLTNCLAIGDVTVVRNDGTVEIVEVKGGSAKSSRTVRQKQKMREVVTFLSTGSGTMEDKFVEVERLDIIPENGLNELARLLEESGPRGWAGKRISNCVYVECIDFRNGTSAEAIASSLDEVKAKEIGEWQERGDTLQQMTSLDLLSFSPNCVPFSVYPFPARRCVDLMTGATCYDVLLNVSAVQREFEYRGWSIVKTYEQQTAKGNQDALMIVEKGGFEVHVPPGELMRIWMELMRVAVLIKECDIRYRRGPSQREGYSYAVYEGEASVWD